MTNLVQWQRFWYPHDKEPNLHGGGYLIDPLAENGKWLNPNVVTFESIESIPCLVLLAEPGMGKTRTLRDIEFPRIKQVLESEGNKCLWVDLAECRSDYRLDEELIKSDEIKQFLLANHRLHIFLDSLDEGLMSPTGLLEYLLRFLRKTEVLNNLERLYLRLVCRSSVWPIDYQNKLKKLWTEEQTRVFKLASLRRQDVERFAKEKGIVNEECFLQELAQKQAVPFAVTPATLQMLVSLYKRGGQFPSKQTELYEQGCLQLCEDNESRKELGVPGKVPVDTRMKTAGRIAVATIFTDQPSVFIGSRSDSPEVNIAGLLFDNEREALDKGMQNAIEETLTCTGLFTTTQSKQCHWVHRTYAEFLAAWFLLKSKSVPVKQVLRLLTIPEGENRRVVPQLQGTAAWAASLNQEIFQEILQTDPDVLLRSDLGDKSPEQVVGQLLKFYDENKLWLDETVGIFEDSSPRLYALLSKLKHSKLADQLRPYLQDKAKNEATRKLAADISSVCEVKELDAELLEIVLDESQPFGLRVAAGHALVKVGAISEKAKLKPLIFNPVEEDVHDYFKGFGLLACWPDFLSSTELFQALKPSRQRIGGGPFNQFLESNFVAFLSPNDLPVALQWMSEHLSLGHRNSFEAAFESIIKAAWNNLEIPEVINLLGKIELSQLKRYFPSLINSELSTDLTSRHRFIEEIVSLLSVSERNPAYPYLVESPYVLEQDIPWFIEKIDSNRHSPETQEKLSQFFIAAFYKRNGDTIMNDTIITAYERYPTLLKHFAKLIGPIDLTSSEALEMQAAHYKLQKRTEQRRTEKTDQIIDPPPAEQVTSVLAEVEAGNVLSWWKIPYLLALKGDNPSDDPSPSVDITQLPGWLTSDFATREKITEFAFLYLIKLKPGECKRLQQIAGYQALYLLCHGSLHKLEGLPGRFWEPWLAALLDPPFLEKSDDHPDYQKSLVALAYRQLPAEFLKKLEELIDKKEATDCKHLVEIISDCLDSRMKEALLTKAKEPQLSLNSIYWLLDLLYRNHKAPASAYLEELLHWPVTEDERTQGLFVVAVNVLIQNEADIHWKRIWLLFEEHRHQIEQFYQISISIFQRSLTLLKKWDWVAKLTESQLADLYIWLERNYSYRKDSQSRRLVSRGSCRDSVDFFRRGILNELKNKGTQLACDELQRIVATFPDLSFHRRYFIEAQIIRRQDSWQPPSVTELFDLISHSEKRYVQNETELLEVVIESLNRLQQKLKGKTSAVFDLWNETRGLPTKPKLEIRLSDYVQRHFHQDLREARIITNREVEIRPRRSKKKRGEVTDILVEVFIRKINKEKENLLTLIVEIKGCWNKDLMKDMEQQLVNRYLTEMDNCCGLYLVGWFLCDNWKEEPRKKVARSHAKEIGDLRQRLQEQAEKLSTQNRNVRTYVLDVTP